MKTILKYLLPLGLAGFLLWFAYKDMDFDQMWIDLKNTHFWAVFLTLVTTVIAHFFRAARWNMLFVPMGYKVSLKNSFLAVMSGYFANLIFPRAGEVTRCTVLFTSEKIPLQTSIGTVLAERGLDLIMLGLITLTALGFEFQKLSDFYLGIVSKYGNQSSVAENSIPVKWIVLAVVVVIGGVVYLLRRRLAQIPIIAKILSFAKGLMDGIFAVLKVKNPILFIVYTILIWAGYYFTTYLSLYMFDFTHDLGFKAALMLLVIGSFGMVAPVQGGVGAFHILVSSALIQLYDKNEALSKTAAAMMHGSQTIFTLILGGICFLFSVVLANREKKELQAQQAQNELLG